MKLTDYVIQFLAEQNIRHVFGVTGGAVVHFFDSAAKSVENGKAGVEPIFTHHEQAASLAAVAYAKAQSGLGAAIVTTGPGGTNAITAVSGAWQDSTPCLIISGQSRYEHTSRGKPVRQIGVQELDIISIVTPITKYAVMLERPEDIRYELEKARYYALEGRPGPAWVDIPVNFHWVDIDPEKIRRFEPPKQTPKPDFSAELDRCVELLKQAKRPLIHVGYGVRLAHAHEFFAKFVTRAEIPFVSSWTAADYLPASCDLYNGRIGFSGQRGANLAIQNCDFLLGIGTHFCLPQTGTLFNAFAREAKIAVVNIDKAQLDYVNVRVDLPIQADAGDFLEALDARIQSPLGPNIREWRELCRRYAGYNAVPASFRESEEYTNSYAAVDYIADLADEGDMIVIDGGGMALYSGFQAFKVKRGQRLMVSSAMSCMGTGLPESVGACFCSGRQRTICVIGDGSFQFNVHELQTIFHHQLPIKIFVMNNGGYLAIRHTQDGFLEGRHVGTNQANGLSLPDVQKVAAAYGINCTRVHNFKELQKKLPTILAEPQPYLCEIIVSPQQPMCPTQAWEANPDGTFRPLPLEDMSPRLDRSEFSQLMVVKPYSPQSK